jgi:effector-binding domain-containing protein
LMSRYLWGKELMMVAEQHGDDVEIQQLDPQPVLSIRATVQIAELAEAMGDRLAALSGYLQQSGARPAGSPFVRYHTFGESETDMEVGIPVVEPVAGEGRIAAGALPGGPATTTWHLGPHDRLGDAYARLEAGRTAHGREPAGAPWEVYHWINPGQDRGPASSPDPSSWRTQLIQPIKESQPR